MGVRVLMRSVVILGVAALCSTWVVPRAWAEPVPVTSGEFYIPWDDPTSFQFFGPRGFVLSSLFISTPSSPQAQCFRGCAPGTAVSLGAVAGGVSPFTRFPLGTVTGAIIEGRVFHPPDGIGPHSPRLAGTLDFDAPTVVLPPFDGSLSLVVTMPFTFMGQAVGFAADDLDAWQPLFELSLSGHGTVRAVFDTFGGVYGDPEVTYTFTPAPIPEPASLLLMATALGGLGVRRYCTNRRRLRSARND